MENWIINTINGEGIPSIMKILHIGDFIELIYQADNERTHGGYVVYLGNDSPKTDEKNKIYTLGLSTSHPSHNENEETLWAGKITKFRIIHKGISLQVHN
jgi:hypothetical protein